MQTIAIIVGTRPEAIKLAPVYLAFHESKRFRPVLVSTGQHQEMLSQTLELFELKPDVDLNVMVPDQSLAGLTSRLLTTLSEFLENTAPAAVVVQGDTTTCMVASLAAFYQRIKVVHVEAGLRTGDRSAPFPEEINRRITDDVSDLLFAPTRRAAEALAREGITEHVFVVGNTVIDSLLLMHARVRTRIAKYRARFAEVISPGQKMVLITGHRRESFGRGFEQICEAITVLARSYPHVAFVYPVHLNPNVQNVVRAQLEGLANLKLLPPVPYDELVYLLGEAWIVMTDSGGIQEEAPSLGKPVIVMRAKTERPEGVEAGCAVLAGNEAEKLVSAFRRIAEDPETYRRMSTGNNPYGDGHTSRAIVRHCDELL